MLVFKIAAMAIIAAILAVTLRQYRPEIALQVSVAAGLLILLAVVEHISGILNEISTIVSEFGIASEKIAVVFKVIGIAYIAQFAAQTCRDSGEGALAGKVELSAKVLMLTLTIPIVKDLLKTAVALLWQS